MAYGFEAYRSDGSTLISSTDGVARLVYSSDIAADFSGTISVPAFDSNLGYFYARMYPFKHYYDYPYGDFLEAENTDWTAGAHMNVNICPSRGPTLSWDNSTKVLTITANSESQNLHDGIIRYRYRLMMVHYK